MDNDYLQELKTKLYAKDYNMAFLADEYGCRGAFVSQFFAGKVASKHFLAFCLSKINE